MGSSKELSNSPGDDGFDFDNEFGDQRAEGM